MPKDSKYRRHMKEFVSPSPPPPPSREKDVRTATLTAARSADAEQVFEFSFLDRAGLVKVATEQTAKASKRPVTPFPKQVSPAAGVSGFTPSRPVNVVCTDVVAGPSTSGVLGEGFSQQGEGGRPICTPSPALGWDKSVAGRGMHHSDSISIVAAPIAAPASSPHSLFGIAGEGDSSLAQSSRCGALVGALESAHARHSVTAPIPLSSADCSIFISQGGANRPLGFSQMVPLSGLGAPSSQAGGWAGGSVPSAAVSSVGFPPTVSGPALIRPQWASGASGLAPPIPSQVDPWSMWGWRFPGAGFPWSWWCPPVPGGLWG